MSLTDIERGVLSFHESFRKLEEFLENNKAELNEGVFWRLKGVQKMIELLQDDRMPVALPFYNENIYFEIDLRQIDMMIAAIDRAYNDIPKNIDSLNNNDDFIKMMAQFKKAERNLKAASKQCQIRDGEISGIYIVF